MYNLVVLYSVYYDFNNNQVTTGGIQTYLNDLIKIVQKLGSRVSVYQMDEIERHAVVNNADIYSIKAKPGRYQYFSNIVAKRIDLNTSYVLYASDTMIPRIIPFHRTIAIQHGVCWDIPRANRRNVLLMLLSKVRRDFRITNRIGQVDHLVCVDYNFINWYRAQVDRPSLNIHMIPNYAKISSVNSKPHGIIKIIFARRFFWYRGTRVFIKAISQILREYPNVFVTLAGTGPDELLLKESLSSFANVDFIKYDSSESIQIHADKNIAVVPTVGSEGTSLSLLEAMSAQCAVVASDVGGITNIILDGFNGILVKAGDDYSLYNGIKMLIDDSELCSRLARNGYESVRQSFSYDKWKDKWEKVLKETILSD